MAENVLELMSGLDGWLLVLLTFGLAYGETAVLADFFVPGEVGMVVAGASAARADLPLPLMIAAGAIGALAGDSTSYWIGRTVGPKVIHKWKPIRKRLEPRIGRANRYFEEKGGVAVFFGRFVGALRAVVPLAAGIGRMPFGRFLAWNVAASIAWAGTVISLGWALGDEIADAVDRFGLVLSTVAVAALVAWFLIRRRRKS